MKYIKDFDLFEKEQKLEEQYKLEKEDIIKKISRKSQILNKNRQEKIDLITGMNAQERLLNTLKVNGMTLDDVK